MKKGSVWMGTAIAVFVGWVGVAAAQAPATGGTSLKVAPDIEARRAQFVTKPLAADLEALAPTDRAALRHLVNAAKELHKIYMEQVWSGNLAFAEKVEKISGPNAAAAKEYYRLMAQPWDKLKEREPFLGDVKRPAGAGFYPEGLTAADFEGWLKAHPADRVEFTSERTIILKDAKGGLVAKPFGKAYKTRLALVAKELKTAASLTTSPTLTKYLELRAAALLSDDYFKSDMAWMDIEGPIEVVIGPYETYEDSLMGLKASYEAFICVTQPEDAAKLQKLKGEIPFLERNLPIPDEYKNLKRGSSSPIKVADVVFSAGDARSGVQTIAFNLPNDERVREAKGSKKVMLKNVMQAKYEAILTPIASRVLSAEDAKKVDFESYFNFVLFHEMSHGLGPGRLVLDGRQTEVRLELKDLYSAIEEAKADVVGVFNLYALADKGLVSKAVTDPLPWTYVAGLFRTARFGVTEAHGRGVVLQTNYLLSKGAVEITENGLFHPVPGKFRSAIEALGRDLLLLEAKGDYPGTQKFVGQYGTPDPRMLGRIAALTDIPVDIDPYYTLFEKR